jgi:glycerol 2-dehydrogenase (NADP+)
VFPGRRLVCEDPVIKDLAVKYDVTPTQIILGWGLARGVSLSTQSKNELHRKQTLNVRFWVVRLPVLPR